MANKIPQAVSKIVLISFKEKKSEMDKAVQNFLKDHKKTPYEKDNALLIPIQTTVLTGEMSGTVRYDFRKQKYENITLTVEGQMYVVPIPNEYGEESKAPTPAT